MIILKLIVAMALLLFFFWFASQGIEPLDPMVLEGEPPQWEDVDPLACQHECVWLAQRHLFSETGKTEISSKQFNKITAACFETCYREDDDE